MSLLGPQRRTALALSAGLGGAGAPTLSSRWAAVVHVPLTLTASRELRPWLVPYAAVGYGSYWIFG